VRFGPVFGAPFRGRPLARLRLDRDVAGLIRYALRKGLISADG
jgi:hypothetical protein